MNKNYFLNFCKEVHDYQLNLKIIIENANILKKKKINLVIVTKFSKNVDYFKSENIFYIFYNQESEVLNSLSLNLKFKYEFSAMFVKYQTSIILFNVIDVIVKKFDIDKIIYFHYKFKIKNSIDEDFFKLISKSDILFFYLSRSIINYLDDTNFFVINNKHFFFKKFIKETKFKINSLTLLDEFQLDMDFLFTKIRFELQNKHNITNHDFSKEINTKIKKNNIFDSIKQTKLDKYFGNRSKVYNDFLAIKIKKLSKLQKMNLDIDNFFNKLEFEGLLDKSINILEISDNSNIHLLYKKKVFSNININEFIKNNNNINYSKFNLILFTKANFITIVNFKDIIKNLKKKNIKIIMRFNYFVKKKENFNPKNIVIISEYIKKKFTYFRIINNFRSDIYIFHD